MSTKTDREIVHLSAIQIVEKINRDGDLREGEGLEKFEVYADDDLGFYQQGCEYVMSVVAAGELLRNRQIKSLEKRNAEMIELVEELKRAKI